VRPVTTITVVTVIVVIVESPFYAQMQIAKVCEVLSVCSCRHQGMPCRPIQLHMCVWSLSVGEHVQLHRARSCSSGVCRGALELPREREDGA